MNKNFLALQAKLIKFGELFIAFTNMDDFVNSQDPLSTNYKSKPGLINLLLCLQIEIHRYH